MQRAIIAAKSRHVVKLQAHGRRLASRRHVAARMEAASAEACEADIEAAMRRMIEASEPAALPYM